MSGYYDSQRADDVCQFFSRYLRHTKTGKFAGKPLSLEPWQEAFMRPLFGEMRPDGTRRYRTAYVELPRKNGKSTLAAGVALLLLLADREPGAEVYSAARDRQQASIVFGDAKKMLQASPQLASRVKIYRAAIEVPTTGSVYRVVSSDALGQHGLNASGIIFDELHAQPDRDLWDALATSVGSRSQPLTFAITTAGYDRHSLCWEMHDYATKVRDGVIDDPAFLPVIYAADEADDWTQEATWRKANPNYGISIHEEYFRERVAEALASPAKENTFRQLHLNQWTEQAVRWLSVRAWDACSSSPPVEDLAGAPCYAGLDLSSTTDLTSLSLVFPDRPEPGHYTVLTECWVPGDSAREREKRDRVPYRLWARDGHIHLTDGNVIDYERVRARIHELGDRFTIKQIAIDRWNATQLSTQLADDGLDVVAFGQGYASMSAPSKDLESLVLSQRLHHGGHPVLRWCASNVAVETDAAGNLKPSKKKSTERIDCIVSLVMAIGLAAAYLRHSSIYEDRGVLTL